MNSITIAGNIARDIEIKYLTNGDPVGNFSIADNQAKDKPAIFWRCSLFGKRAEALAPYLLKGQAVTISGEVTEREYTDKEGTNRTVQEVRVGNVMLQGGKRDSKPAQQSAPAARGADMDDEIPF